MPNKVIQIPVDEILLQALDSVSRKRGQSRSALIREACLRYLRQEELRQMDEIYQEGYKRLPEEPAIGTVQAGLTSHIFSKELW